MKNILIAILFFANLGFAGQMTDMINNKLAEGERSEESIRRVREDIGLSKDTAEEKIRKMYVNYLNLIQQMWDAKVKYQNYQPDQADQQALAELRRRAGQ